MVSEVIAWCVVIGLPALLVWYALGRIRQEEQASEMDKLIKDAQAGKLNPTVLEDAKNGVISVSEDGFAIQRGMNRCAEVKWSAVAEIRAYKADLFGYDLICWGFCSLGDDDMVEVHEQMAGFEKLQEIVGVRYGVRLEDWWDKVAFPAFATNMTVIWAQEECGGKVRATDSSGGGARDG